MSARVNFKLNGSRIGMIATSENELRERAGEDIYRGYLKYFCILMTSGSETRQGNAANRSERAAVIPRIKKPYSATGVQRKKTFGREN
jgi:hypothetical protein